MSMDFKRKLPIPQELKLLMPLPERLVKAKRLRDEQVESIIAGKDTRLLVIVGPCSSDSKQAVLEYCVRLAKLQESVSERLLLVPRVYTSKPRSTGVGYKGMLHQPDPAADDDMVEGVKAIRDLHLSVIAETGLFPADEMLYPASYRFISDLLGYVAIGARSVENQEHRHTASGIDVPVGMKNPLYGDLPSLLNAVHAAQHSHMFVYRNWEVVTQGNPYAHCILRGYVDSRGANRPNYGIETLEQLYDLYISSRLQHPAAIIDCNHSNSDKNALRQPDIVREVLQARSVSQKARCLVKGFMIESYLEDGSQVPGGGLFGCSITDPCLGWEKTERLLWDVAECC